MPDPSPDNPSPQASASAGGAGAPARADGDAGYARVAKRGLVLTAASVAVNKGFTLVAQLLLAMLLTQTDFGLVAMAAGVSMFVQTFRDGGVRELLTQRPAEYDALEGSLFWLAGVMNLAVALVLGVAGEVAAHVYTASGLLTHPGELTTLVWVMAAAVPLGTPAVILHAKLRIDLRFRALAEFTIISGVVRYGGQITLALLDFGAMSVVLPTIAVSITESAFCIAATGRAPWTKPAEVRRWKGVLGNTMWVVGGSTCAGVANMGYMLLAAPFISRADLGVYYFAVQILMQIETLVGQSVVTVLFPIMARMQDDPARQGQAAIRVVRATGLVVSPLCVGLGVLWPAIDLIVFQGKWAVAGTPLLILGLFYPLRTILIAVPNAALMAQGRFREWFYMWLWNGAGLVVLAGLAAWLTRDIDDVSWFVGVFLALSCLWFTTVVVHRLRVRRREIVIASLLTPLIAAAAGVGCVALDALVLQPWLYGHGLVHPSGGGLWALAGPAAVRAAILGGLFSGVYVAAVRTLAARQVHEALQVLPARVRGPVARVLRMR